MPEIAAYLPTRLGERFVCRSRPVGPSFEPGPDGATLRPARVELGIVGCPDAWIPVDAAIWTHACGLTLRRAGFVQAAGGRWEAWKPWASLRGRALLVGEADESERIVRLSYLQALYNALHRTDTLRLAVRLIGSVEADACVLGLAERRISSSCPYSAERVVRRPGRFACRQASPAGGELPDLPAALGDDTAPAGAYAAALRDAGEHGLGRGTITLRNVTRAYAPGSAIDATDGRTVALAAGAESPAPVVVAVTWRLGDGVNKTDLTLETPTGGLRS
jgi:hypothetical protein